MRTWLLLHYKTPSEPSAPRVYVWRKLKRLGALLIQDAVWVLPPTPYTREQFQWLAAEIVELGGEVMLWEGRLLLSGQDDDLVGQFIAQVDEAYRQTLAGLQHPEPDLAALSRQCQQARLKDYFHSELGRRVREALIAAREETSP